MVDPKLAGQSNRNAITPGNRLIDGGVPAIPAGRAAAAAEAAAAMKAGKLVKAPNALPFAGGANEPKTIGALAAQQSKIKCESPLSYDRGWADRQIGRASGRERVGQYVSLLVGAETI